MRTTIVSLTTTAALALTLSACSASSPTHHAPATTTTPPAASTTLSRAELIEQCVQAMLDGRDEGDGAPECTNLSLDDYYDALHEANQRGREELGREIEKAEESAPDQTSG